jgi:opacity protein-like surface antigen
MNKKNLVSVFFTMGLISTASLQAAEQAQRGLYLGVFGGGSVSDNNNFTQSGVAYKRVGDGQAHTDYDLLVNVKGSADSKAGAMGGLHVGYEWSEIPMGNSGSEWGLRPALELEGYYLGTSQTGNLLNPQTEPAVWHGEVEASHSLAAGSHTFRNTFNLDMGVLLANVVFSFKTPWSNKIYPYIGGGIGAAITSISRSDSKQVDPVAEPTINHFNSDSSASSSSFAAQGKAGIRAEIVEHLSVFAEYRYLHVTATHYTFGATVYPGVHSQTSAWNSNFGAMNFHTGVLGIEYSF